MATVHAIYSNSVFRPTMRVEVPDNVEVEFGSRVVAPPGDDDLDAAYEILRRRFRSGQNDVARRYDEHEP